MTIDRPRRVSRGASSVVCAVAAVTLVGVPLIGGGLASPAAATQKLCTDLDARALNATTCERVLDRSTLWTIPAGVTKVDMIVMGGGGGGGAGPAAPDFGAGGGGAGGEVLLKLNVAVTPGAAHVVTIGQGGYGAGQPGVGWGSSDGQDGTATSLLGFTARGGRGGVGASAGSGGAGGATDTRAGGAINGLNGGGGASFATSGGPARGTCSDGRDGGGGGLGAPGVTVVGGLFPAGDIYNSYPLGPGGSGGSSRPDPTTCTGWRVGQQYAGGGAGIGSGAFAENASIPSAAGGGGGASGYVTGNSHVRQPGGKGSVGAVIIRFLLPPPTWQVNYDGNGQTSGGAPWPPITHTDGDEVSVLDNIDHLLKIGYLFDGWNTQADGSGTSYQPGDMFDISEDMTLYAQWRVAAAMFTVGYSFAGFTGGTAPADPNSPYEEGDRVTVLDNVGNLSRDGYTFDGWSTQMEGKGTRYQPGDTFRIRADTALFPVWVVGDGGGSGGGAADELGPVRNLKFTMRSAKGAARVTWKIPASNGGSPVVGYVVKYRLVGTTDWTNLGQQSSTTVRLKKLIPSESYDVWVVPVTKKETGPAKVITGLISKLPSAPREVKADPADGRVTVTWTEPASTGTSAVKLYVVKASVGKGRCTAKADERTCVVTGLKNGTRYSFTVRARNGSGFGKPGISRRVIPGRVPGAVSALVVKVRRSGLVLVDWSKPAANGGVPVTGYTVTYQAAGVPATSVNVTDTQANVSGLMRDVAYTFTVVARNSFGQGEGAEVSKTL